ncbi:MAG TPA: polymer-forming cytoskeletal protein [Bacteriovoracaceae bacterium]|nr:polymer-forming cytoskeletal protein [Bacteriovoracaceae bacterium]
MINGNDFKNFQYNVLGAETQLTGNINFSGDAIITATIEGNIKMLNSSKLILERGSKIKGQIEAFDLEVFGEVIGDILSEGSVAIRSSAQVTGSIKAKKLIIYPGAIVDTTAISQG